PKQQVVGAGEFDAVAAAAEDLGWPVVLKAIAPGLVHKSDAGGVRTGLDTQDQVESAAAEMVERIPDLTGFLIQQQASPGTELIVGSHRDPAFGPVVLVGLGGVWVEALDDVSLRLAPVSHDEALEMLAELKGS